MPCWLRKKVNIFSATVPSTAAEVLQQLDSERKVSDAFSMNIQKPIAELRKSCTAP